MSLRTIRAPGHPLEFANTAPGKVTIPDLTSQTGTVVIANLAQTLTNKTLTSPTITGPTITSPTLTFNAATATGAGTNLAGAQAVTTASPAVMSVTGATDTGFRLPTGTAGKVMVFRKQTTDVLNLYATTGDTLNGGTSAVAIGAIGTILFCAVDNAWLAMTIAS